MDIKIIMEATRRMRDFQKKARQRSGDYQFKEGQRAAEKEVDRLIKEWEMEEFHKHQGQLF